MTRKEGTTRGTTTSASSTVENKWNVYTNGFVYTLQATRGKPQEVEEEKQVIYKIRIRSFGYV